MAQQYLQGRGLSQTILQPTDILGEAQARQQQEQMLAARQQAAQKPKKPFEIKAPEETYGRIFGPLQNKVVNMYTKWARENADKIDRDSVYYDEETARQNEMYKAGLRQLSTMTVEVDNIYDKDAEGLTEYEITAGGFLNFTNEALNFGDNVFMQDGNWYYKKSEDEEPVLATQAGILTSPRSMYATFAGADEYFDKEVGTIKKSLENIEGVTTTEGAAEMIRPRIMTKLATARNKDALKRDIVLNDLMAQGGYNKPEDISQEVFEQLMQNEDYVNDVINRYADAKSLDLALKAGRGKSIEQGGGATSYGGAAALIGMVRSNFVPYKVYEEDPAKYIEMPDRIKGVSIDNVSIDTPQGTKNITNLFVDAEKGEVYYSGSEARNKIQEELEKYSEREDMDIGYIPTDEYINIITNVFEPVDENISSSLRANIRRKTKLNLRTTDDLKNFILSEYEGTEEPQQKDSGTEQNTISISKAKKDLPDLLGNLSDEEIREMYEEDGYKVIE